MQVSEGIRDLCSDNPTAEAERLIINECLVIAKAYLRMKNSDYIMQALHLNAEDLALDLIAELFKRNEKGNFEEFQSYFKPMIEKKMSFFELEINLRRRVFTEVNDRWFDIIKTWDPILARIVRMIKYHFNKDERFEMIHYFKSKHIRLKKSYGIIRLWNKEEIGFYLGQITSYELNMTDLPNMISAMVENEPNSCIQQFSIIDLASVYRDYVMQRNIVSEEVEQGHSAEVALFESESYEELLKIYIQVKENIYQFILDTYVKTNKICEEVAGTYLSVVDRVHYGNYFDHAKNGLSYSKVFQELNPEVTTVEYYSTHKSKIEYIGNKLSSEFVKKVKKNWEFQQSK